MDKKKASKLLGVPLTASIAEIKVAYKKAALKWHPDKNQHDIGRKYRSEIMIKIVNQAKEIFQDQ